MADNRLANWQPFLFDLKGRVWEVFSSEAPFLSELSGYDNSMGMVDRASKVQRISSDMDGGRDIFSGKQVRHTLILAGLPGGGNPTESGTWNQPIELSSVETHIKLIRMLVPFSVTVDVERDSFDNSNATAVATLVAQARSALARLENLEYLGDGTGNVCSPLGVNTGLVIPVPANTNFNILLPGTVWDIVTTSTGAPVGGTLGVGAGGGNRRKIASVQEAALTVTLDTAQQAADGGSGTVTTGATMNFAVPGSAVAPASAGTQPAQGLEQAGAYTGTFQDVDKAAVAAWQGVDGRGGVTTPALLTDTILDGAVRRGRRSGLGAWDFALGDEAVIDGYKGSKASLVRYDPQVTTLKSGFSGIAYDGADRPFPLIKEPMMLRGAVRLIDKESFQLYGDQPGPSFLEDDGSMFRRFARSLPKEAELLDRVQLGVTKCNTIIRIDNLLGA